MGAPAVSPYPSSGGLARELWKPAPDNGFRVAKSRKSNPNTIVAAAASGTAGRRSHFRDDGHDHRPAAEVAPRPLADGAPHDLLQLFRRGLPVVHSCFQGGDELRAERFEPGPHAGDPAGVDLRI